MAGSTLRGEGFAAADFQIPRIAKVRGISVDSLKAIVSRHTQARTFGIFGELRIFMPVCVLLSFLAVTGANGRSDKAWLRSLAR